MLRYARAFAKYLAPVKQVKTTNSGAAALPTLHLIHVQASQEQAPAARSVARKEADAKPGVRIKKASAEQQVVFGEVYAPGIPDSQGDFMTAETIREMAWGFMQKSSMDKIDVQHSQEECGAYVVESFIARDDDPVFIPGSWVIGVKVPDPTLWGLIKSGEINGFSLDGFGYRVATKIELEIPSVLKGETAPAEDGHTHSFEVFFNDEGDFIGGYTSKSSDGHRHKIERGTSTEDAGGHSHRFSFVEGILLAENAD